MPQTSASPATAPGSTPPLGLLLDVDGPIASPLTRSIAIPSIVEDLVRLATAGVPIVFNTGRSDAFLRDEVVGPLVAAGLPEHARVFAVCEKGAVWFEITSAGMGELSVDGDLAVPEPIGRAVEALVAERFADHVFFDDTKRAMVSVEQRTDVSGDAYRPVQRDFDARAFAEFERHGLGVTDGSREAPSPGGDVDYRIDATIISTDIESVVLGKDLGARRAIDWLEQHGTLPVAWRTVGDSRTDYAMADWLHRNGFEVAHVDVRPADGVPETPYPVLTAGDLVHDEAGAAFLARWVDMVHGRAAHDRDVA
ncbi:hypothetical protein ACDF64_07995 [Agromyces sp. MMS24-JH15]|uniref:hypothetical protein n=1 Tax=Agromyces sp. MMS24-JH15 TaxID=3243765 RepID=UPI0037490E52